MEVSAALAPSPLQHDDNLTARIDQAVASLLSPKTISATVEKAVHAGMSQIKSWKNITLDFMKQSKESLLFRMSSIRLKPQKSLRIKLTNLLSRSWKI